MQVNKILLKIALALSLAAAFSSTAFAGCRNETRFNEFTRTWSTNNVCDFGSAPVNSGWSFGSPSYAPAYVAPTYIAPVYTLPSFSWSLPSWVWEPSYTYVEPVYSVPVVAEVPTYLDSGFVQTPVDLWDFNNQSWTPGWVEEPADRWGDSFGEFFTFW
jgi:hypothetical protein